jgi:hypothetical protein
MNSFDVRTYVQNVTNIDFEGEEGLRKLHVHLKETEDLTSSTMQRNVYRNYTEFITISKEISQFESDMISFKTLLKDLKSNVEALSSSVNGSGIDMSKSNSKINLNQEQDIINEQQRQQQIFTIRDQVEGSQRYLNEVSRTLVNEGGGLSEITAKRSVPVHFYLFNDSILVALKRKKMAYSVKYQLVADKLIPLEDLSIHSKVDDEELKHAFRLDSESLHESFTFKCDSSEIKKSWISKIEIQMHTIKTSKKPTMVETKEAKEENTSIVPTFKRSISAAALTNPFDTLNTQQIASISEMIDELTVFIAQCEYDKSVELYTKIKCMLDDQPAEAPRVSEFQRQLRECVEQLAFFIGHELGSLWIGKNQVRAHISRLMKLGLSEQAREIFLASRSHLLQRNLKELRMEGDIVTYVYEYGAIVTTMIKCTCDWYSACFEDIRMTSGLALSLR